MICNYYMICCNIIDKTLLNVHALYHCKNNNNKFILIPEQNKNMNVTRREYINFKNICLSKIIVIMPGIDQVFIFL